MLAPAHGGIKLDRSVVYEPWGYKDAQREQLLRASTGKM